MQDKKSVQETTNGESKSNKKDKKGDCGKKTDARNGQETNHSLANLAQQLDVAEEAQVRDLQTSWTERLQACFAFFG